MTAGRSTDNLTSLTWAAQGGHLEICRLLLDKGAGPDVLETNGFTPLMRASQNGHWEVARLLLQRGADKGIKALGHTALSLAKTPEVRCVLR